VLGDNPLRVGAERSAAAVTDGAFIEKCERNS